LEASGIGRGRKGEKKTHHFRRADEGENENLTSRKSKKGERGRPKENVATQRKFVRPERWGERKQLVGTGAGSNLDVQPFQIALRRKRTTARADH